MITRHCNTLTDYFGKKPLVWHNWYYIDRDEAIVCGTGVQVGKPGISFSCTQANIRKVHLFHSKPIQTEKTCVDPNDLCLTHPNPRISFTNHIDNSKNEENVLRILTLNRVFKDEYVKREIVYNEILHAYIYLCEILDATDSEWIQCFDNSEHVAPLKIPKKVRENNYSKLVQKTVAEDNVLRSYLYPHLERLTNEDNQPIWFTEGYMGLKELYRAASMLSKTKNNHALDDESLKAHNTYLEAFENVKLFKDLEPRWWLVRQLECFKRKLNKQYHNINNDLMVRWIHILASELLLAGRPIGAYTGKSEKKRIYKCSGCGKYRLKLSEKEKICVTCKDIQIYSSFTKFEFKCARIVLRYSKIIEEFIFKGFFDEDDWNLKDVLRLLRQRYRDVNLTEDSEECLKFVFIRENIYLPASTSNSIIMTKSDAVKYILENKYRATEDIKEFIEELMSTTKF
ncbi:hypothetical protein GJ496_003776 [Pomphorhynchus laevis]|nr:hypothetical protein GJ496_003776 [Pomphorhynchus laevis]